jgi:SAM-dependent methyltransferase
MFDDVFWKVHSGLEREGPGDEGSFRRAFAMLRDLPSEPSILDVGSGPGAQTFQLAEATRGRITSVDTHQRFLDELERGAAARGFSDRIRTVNASMAKLPFDDASFDLIWSEGAAYIMGFVKALARWKRLLTPRGYIAVTEPCWLQPVADTPEGALKEWREYPAMKPIPDILKDVADAGYREVGHFPLPPAAWLNYYDPMQRRIDALREEFRSDAASLEKLAVHQAEVDGYRRYGRYYSYLFIVMQVA